MEYDYAVNSGKPAIGFVIDKSVNLASNLIELESDRRQALENFKSKLHKRLCKFWINTPDLGAKVSRSITQLIKREPATGWVRADALTQVNSEETLRLKNRVLELERSLVAQGRSPLAETETLAQGDDQFVLRANIYAVFQTEEEGRTKQVEERLGTVGVQTDWNAMSLALGHTLLVRTERSQVISDLRASYKDEIMEEATVGFGAEALNKADEIKIYITRNCVEAIKIQFMALGLISIDVEPGRNTFLSDPREFWVPTANGSDYFVRKLAIKRTLSASSG